MRRAVRGAGMRRVGESPEVELGGRREERDREPTLRALSAGLLARVVVVVVEEEESMEEEEKGAPRARLVVKKREEAEEEEEEEVFVRAIQKTWRRSHQTTREGTK
jgi:hypothetical protein